MATARFRSRARWSQPAVAGWRSRASPRRWRCGRRASRRRCCVLGGVPAQAERAQALALTPVIHHPGDLEAARRAARASGRPWTVQVEIDTGMRRMGVAPEQAAGLLEAVAREPALRLEGVFTHFARADEPDLAPFARAADDLSRRARAGAGARRRSGAGARGAVRRPALGRPARRGAAGGRRRADRSPALWGAPGRPPGRWARAGHDPFGARGARAARSAAGMRSATPRSGARGGPPASPRSRSATPTGSRSRPPTGARSGCAGGGCRWSGASRWTTSAVDAGDAPVEIGDQAIVFGPGRTARFPSRRPRSRRRRFPTSCWSASARGCRASTRSEGPRPA